MQINRIFGNDVMGPVEEYQRLEKFIMDKYEQGEIQKDHLQCILYGAAQIVHRAGISSADKQDPINPIIARQASFAIKERLKKLNPALCEEYDLRSEGPIK